MQTLFFDYQTFVYFYLGMKVLIQGFLLASWYIHISVSTKLLSSEFHPNRTILW